LAGRFISILGCRKMLYLGLLIYLISTAMYFYTPNLLMLDSVRFLNGFAYGITSTATSTIIAAIIPTSRRGEGINYYGLSTSLAAAVGPFLGILMLHSLGYDFIIAFCVVLIILCGIGSVIMKFNEPKLGIESEGHKGIRISDYIEPRMNSISLVSILVGFAYSGVIGFMAAYTKDLDLIMAGTFFFVVYAVVITITRPLLGIVFDMKGENFVLYPCFVSLALGIFLLSIAHSTWLVLLSAVFVGLGYGTFMSNGQAVTVKIVPVHRIGVATSTYFIALDMGLGFGPYILGAVKEVVGYASMFHVTVVVALLALVAYYLLYGRYVGTEKDLSLKARAEEEEIRNRKHNGKLA
jgi:MFS transporter